MSIADGRQRIFHGLNVVYKSPPYLPIQARFRLHLDDRDQCFYFLFFMSIALQDHYDPQLSFSQQDIEYFNQWGLNIIRLGFMWPGTIAVAHLLRQSVIKLRGMMVICAGAMPGNGTFNQTYLQDALNLVNNAAQGT